MKYSQPMWDATTKLMSRSANHLRSQEVIRTVAVMAGQIEALEKLIVNKSPMVTDAAHQTTIAKAAEQTKRANDVVRKKFNALHEQSVREVKLQIQEKANLVPSKYSEEIRGRLLNMKHSDRLREITKAIDAKDTITLAAISEGNELMTGIADQARNDLLGAYQQRVCPELFGELESMEEVANDLPVVFEWADEAANASYNSKHVEALLEAENEAKAAQLEFDQTVEA